MSVGDHGRTYGKERTLDSSSVSKCSHDTAESCHGKHLHNIWCTHTRTQSVVSVSFTIGTQLKEVKQINYRYYLHNVKAFSAKNELLVK